MRSLGLGEDLFRYVTAHGAREHPVLAQLRAATAPMRHAGMQIGADQGAFMQLLVKMLGARRTLEIGVFTGYSALAVALALPDDGRVVACDVSEEWTRVAREHWKKAGVDHKIDLRLAPAADTLDALLKEGNAGAFHFAFVDADKANYANYYERCLKLVRAGGVIAFDNTLWSGAVIDPKQNDADTVAIRRLNDMLICDERVDVAMLTVGDGLTLALKR
jgi:caffeoyl-CoA O-methyltransferase